MDEYADGYENYLENMEEDNGNLIIIAGKDFTIYNQKILDKLQRYDQITISVADRFVERAIYIIKQWEAVGVTPQKNKYNPDGRILFIETEEDIILRDKKKMREHVKKIILTKDPNLFRYTRLEKWEQEELENSKRKAGT